MRLGASLNPQTPETLKPALSPKHKTKKARSLTVLESQSLNKALELSPNPHRFFV